MSVLAAATAIGSIVEIVSDIAKRVVADKDEAQKIDMQLKLAQIAVNQAEASSGNMYLAGWRAFIGWACGILLVLHIGVFPTISYFAIMFGHQVPLPAFDIVTVCSILSGLLGFNITARSADKAGGFRNLIGLPPRQPQYGPGSANYQGK